MAGGGSKWNPWRQPALPDQYTERLIGLHGCGIFPVAGNITPFPADKAVGYVPGADAPQPYSALKHYN